MTYDICIIGAGVGGGALAHALAPTGARILLLNKRGSLPREARNWDPQAMFTEDAYKSDVHWTDGATGEPFRPGLFEWIGGNTKVYGSALLRNRPEDFDALQTHDGVSPAWPISYADLAPFYDRAERVYDVHGRRGADPFEPPAHGDFPHPAIEHDERIAEVAEGLRQHSVQAFELPMGVKFSHDQPGLGPFVLRETFEAMGRAAFDGYPDLLHLKADAETATVIPAVAHDNVDLSIGEVTRLVTDASGRTVTHAEAEVDGERVEIRADVFAVCAGAVQSAALLLRSGSDRHPQGLANGSGQVGRNLMRHNVSKLYTVAPGTPNPTRFQKTLAVNDWYFGVPGDPEWNGVPLGHIHLMGKHAGWQIKADLGDELSIEEADDIAAHSVDWWAQTEDLPLAESRVTLDRDGGIVVRYVETNRAAHEHLMDRLVAALAPLGFERELRVHMPINVLNHQCGTCRMGTDPAASVVDPMGRAHEVDNLYLADASVFPSSAATNPTLTIAANAFRVAEHLASEVL